MNSNTQTDKYVVTKVQNSLGDNNALFHFVKYLNISRLRPFLPESKISFLLKVVFAKMKKC